MPFSGVYLSVRTCELFLCFIAVFRVRVYYVDFFVFFVLRHWWVSQVLTPFSGKSMWNVSLYQKGQAYSIQYIFVIERSCYVQLKPVKTMHLLTSITWPYCRLMFIACWGHVPFWRLPLSRHLTDCKLAMTRQQWNGFLTAIQISWPVQNFTMTNCG